MKFFNKLMIFFTKMKLGIQRKHGARRQQKAKHDRQKMDKVIPKCMWYFASLVPQKLLKELDIICNCLQV